jgi:predicted dehydrogenase
MSRRTRRDFLTVSAAAASAAWLSRADEPKKYAAAVIGHTGRGDYGHAMDEVFAARPGIETVAVADAVEAGRARIAAKLKAPRQYADYRELLEKEKPQLVSVAPRHADQHHDMILAALNVGAHVVSEKPFVTTPAEADELLAEADKRNLKIAVAHQMRLGPPIVKLKQAIADGQFGELIELHAFGKQDARAGGEDMMVLGTHLFDLLRLFGGDPEWCSARVLEKGRDITPADARTVKDNIGPLAGDEISAQFSFPRGVLATFTSRGRLRDTTGNWGIEVVCSKSIARILCDIPPHVLVLKTDGWKPMGRTDEWVPLPGLVEDGKPGSGGAFGISNRRVVDDWLDAIEKNRQPECSGLNAAKAVEMVMAVYHAGLSGARVKFPLAVRTHPLAAK